MSLKLSIYNIIVLSVVWANIVAVIISSVTSFSRPKSYLEYSKGKWIQIRASGKKERPDSMKAISLVISDLFTNGHSCAWSKSYKMII